MDTTDKRLSTSYTAMMVNKENIDAGLDKHLAGKSYDASNRRVDVRNTTKFQNNAPVDSGFSSFQKAPFAVYGDPELEFKQALERVKKFNEMKKSSYLKDRDRNVLMGVPVQKKDKIEEKSILKKSILEKSKVSHGLQPVRHDPVIERPKVQEVRHESQKKPGHQLSNDESYNVQYAGEFVDHMISLDQKKKLMYLKQSVSESQRSLVVKYLLKIATNCKYPSFPIFQAVKIFDFYIDRVEVQLNDLQILALACLWIALKKDLNVGDVPTASGMVKISGNKSVNSEDYKRTLGKYEQKVLVALNFEISFAEPFSLLALYTYMTDKCYAELSDEQIHQSYYYGCYVIDLSMMLQDARKAAAVHLAAVAVEISMALAGEKDLRLMSWNMWREMIYAANPILKQFRLVSFEMDVLRVELLQAILRSEHTNTDLHICQKKYASRRYGMISNNLIYKVSLLEKYNRLI